MNIWDEADPEAVNYEHTGWRNQGGSCDHEHSSPKYRKNINIAGGGAKGKNLILEGALEHKEN